MVTVRVIYYTGKGLSPKSNYCSVTYFQVNSNRCMIITGPKMGGKSSYIKQVSINSVLFSFFTFERLLSLMANCKVI